MTNPLILPAVAMFRGPLQDDLFFSDLYGSGTTIRKINDLHGNLCGEPQEIGRIGP